MKYGFSQLFFGHKLRVTRRHQSFGRARGSGGPAVHLRTVRHPSAVSIISKTCKRCGGWYVEGAYASHLKTPGHVASRPPLAAG